MPEFRYSVVDAKGRYLNGTMEAESKEVCRRIIEQRGLYCLELKEASLVSRSISFGNKVKIAPKDMSVFCRQFSSMLSSGIGVIKCLNILYVQAEKPKYKAVYKRIYEAVQRGNSLSAALSAQEGTFPDFMVNMIEAGEASGTLDKVMAKIAEYYEKSLKTKNKVKNAMMYPIILGVLTVFVVIILMVFVLPTFTKMFESSGAELPGVTLLLINFSNSLIDYWYIYLMAVSAIYFGFTAFLRSEKGRLKWDRLKVYAPKIGKLNRIVLSSRFSSTLSTMMQSGIPLLKSLEITSKVIDNKYIENSISQVIEDIRRGIPLSTSVKKTTEFPPMLISMISIGEESGTLDDVLKKTSGFYDEEADTAISKMVGLLEPLMIVVMASVVLFIVVSVMLPMFGMMKTVK